MDLSKVKLAAMGMCSSLGGHKDACAAARAGLTNVTDLEVVVSRDDEVYPVPVTGHECREAAGFEGYARLVLLATTALEDLLIETPASLFDKQRLEIIINIPDSKNSPLLQDTLDQLQLTVDEYFKVLLQRVMPTVMSDAQIKLFSGGHAGVLAGIDHAAKQLLENKADVIIVGGVDSFVEGDNVEYLMSLDKLKTPNVPVGAMAGEGAAFVCLTTKPDIKSLVRLESVLLANEEYDLDDVEVPTAKALNYVIKGVSEYLPPGSEVGMVINDTNGEEVRAIEWGMAKVFCTDQKLPVLTSEEFVAASNFGDVGAAFSAFAICLATRFLNRGFLPVQRIFVFSSSHEGLRGGISLSL